MSIYILEVKRVFFIIKFFIEREFL